MTKRSPVSSTQNLFFDSEQLDDNDLTTEQNYNNAVQAGLINNHIGSGVLPEVLTPAILFDSDLEVGLLDGLAVNIQQQPSDLNLGNQLVVTLSNSKAAGKKAVKVAIIGLDFEGNLQYDTFIFRANESQITKKHYAYIETILFNDLKGTETQSFNLGGRILIQEAKAFSLSRDPVMVAQDEEPNLFWRDFFVASGTLSILLKNALPLYNIDNLNIKTGFKENKILEKNDVVTQIGQKFLATTNNIQKISLLLSVQNTDVGDEDDLNWQGDLVVSIYPLQSAVQCPTDLIPNLALDFPPSNIPLAQLSYNFNTLQDIGITLDGTPQPVDFVFSNTLVANGNYIKEGSYYTVSVKRSGSADKCDILIAAGSNEKEDTRVTTFTGTVWVDIPEDALWFKVYTDAVKISDGQGYDTGHGIIIPKTDLDLLANAQIDYCLDKIQFTGNQLYTGVVSAELEKSVPVQDQRTGNPVFSRQQFKANVKLLNPIDIENLSETTEPLTIGLVKDKNNKFYDSSSSTLTAKFHAWSFVKNEVVIKIIDDDTDGYRYDEDVNALISNVVNGDFVNAKLIPDTSEPDFYYRIAKAEICSMLYGDLNGDGLVNDEDYTLYQKFIGIDLNTSPPSTSNITTDGYTTTFTNGYAVYADGFESDTLLSYQLVNTDTDAVVNSGTDGVLVVNPDDSELATFQSLSLDFTTVSNLTDLKLVILDSSFDQNNGGFEILAVNNDSDNVINIRKVVLTADTICQIMRADITTDFEITDDDGYYIQSYVDKTPIYPATTSPANRVGTPFSVIKLKLDPFTFMDGYITDRTDDFSATTTNRATTLHKTQDIYLEDTNLQSHDFKNSPVTFNVVKQLTWNEELIAVSGNARYVPSVFTSNSGLTINECDLDGVNCQLHPITPEIDPGTIDYFIPNNLILGNGGELKRSDGYFYKVDFEVATVVLEIPANLVGTEKTINLFDNFVANYNDTGTTRLGYPAMRYADCSLVDSSALTNNQVRFAVAVQSFSPNIDGIDEDGYMGPIVDGRIGVYLDQSTSLLRLNFANLYEDPTLVTLVTRIEVTVYLKKAGFNNKPIVLDSTKISNLLQLI